MKRQEYKLLVENWNRFLVEENYRPTKTFKSNDDDELLYLLEWGDNLEKVIIESGDYLLLESLYESNNYVGRLIELKDTLKELFKVRKDAVDDKGNKVKYDDSKESQVKQEYTKLARAGMAAMTALKFATVVFAALNPNMAGGDIAPEKVWQNMNEPVKAAVLDTVEKETGVDPKEIPVQFMKFKKPIKIGPPVQKYSFKPVFIGPKVKKELATTIAKKVSKKVAPDIGEQIVDELGDMDLENVKDTLLDKAGELGIDDGGNLVLNTYTSEQEADMTLANTIAFTMAEKTPLGKTDVNVKSFNPDMSAGGEYDIKDVNDNFKNLPKEVKIKLLRAAKIKAIQDLTKIPGNKDLLKKAKSWTSTVTGYEGEGAGKIVDDQQHHVKGSKEARTLSTLYSTFGDIDFDYQKMNSLKDLEKIFDSNSAWTKITTLNSPQVDQIKGSVIAYVMYNCSNDKIDDLEDNLSKIPNIQQDLDNITDPATTYYIKGSQDHLTRDVKNKNK